MDHFGNEQAEKRDALIRQAHVILDRAPASGMTVTDEREFDSLMAQADEIKKTLDKRNAARGIPSSQYAAPFQQTREGVTWLKRDQSLFKALEARGQIRDEDRELSLERFLRAVIVGPSNAVERRAMSENVLSQGGVLVPLPISAYVIDLARNATQVNNAGARHVIMDSATIKLPRLDQDATPSWVAENQPYTSSDLAFSAVTLTAQALVANVKVSLEMIEDTAVDAEVAYSLGKAIALETDRVALLGSGVGPQPKGIKNSTAQGVTITHLGANGLAPTNYDFISSALQRLQGSNFNASAVLMSPRTYFELDQLKDTQNRYLIPPQSMQKLIDAGKVLTTNQIGNAYTVGSGVTCSDLYAADFSQLALGMRSQLSLEISREASDAGGSAWENRQVFIRAILRMDVAVMRGSAFQIVDGIL